MNPLHGDWYDFWSGVGNDIPIYLLGLLPIYWHHHKTQKKKHEEMLDHLKKIHNSLKEK